MSNRNKIYDVHDLQVLDEKCRINAEALGLSLPNVVFQVVQAEEIYDIAARSLPGRRSHYQFGRRYEEMKRDYDKGRSRIYELVINTDPVHAYLLDGNGLIVQLLVMAHVYGHASYYEHSKYFIPSDKNILPRVRGAAERIDGYIGEYGRDEVEDFVDACESLQLQRSHDLLVTPHVARPPEWEDKPYDLLFPEETEQRKQEFKTEKDEFRHRFPKQPERDLLGFLEQYARRLEDWQRDVISSIRTEVEYFLPNMRSQIGNEAQAVYYHNTILQELMNEDDRFTTDDFMEFQSRNAAVLHPHIAYIDLESGGSPGPGTDPEDVVVRCRDVNPYLTGTEIYREVRRICEDPTDEDRERWWWAGEASWDEKRAELVTGYDDVALISEFLSPRVCERAKLFMRDRPITEYKNLRVLEEECDKVREVIVRGKSELAPYLEIVNADYHNRGELLIEHRHNGIGLDNEYTKGTLPHLARLWGHPVVLHTLSPREAAEPNPEEELHEVWYRATLDGEVDVDIKEPE